LLQESYCRFLAASLPEMDEGQSRSYVFKIATNLLRDRWRRREIPDNIDSTKQSCEDDRETRIDVRRAFDRLKPRERQLLWLAPRGRFRPQRDFSTYWSRGGKRSRITISRARQTCKRAARPFDNGKRSVES